MSARARALPVLTVVLEWNDGGGGGASEEGRAPAGSAELAAAVARASEEAASLAEGGGWASVFVGEGDLEEVCVSSSSFEQNVHRLLSRLRTGRAQPF